MSKKWKVGQQKQKPFPVVEMRWRPVKAEEGDACFLCHGHSILFAVQIYGDKNIAFLRGFSREEKANLLWEKVYRAQKAGIEPEEEFYPLCGQCAHKGLTEYLNNPQYERDAAKAIALSVASGKDIMLVDRNLDRQHNYPAVFVGTFETLADFRRHYWAELEDA